MKHRFLVGFLIGNPNAGAECYALAGQLLRVDHLGAAGHILKLGNPALDKGLAFTRGMIFGIFRQIAMFTRHGDGVDHSQTLGVFQMRQLCLDCFQPLWGKGYLFHLALSLMFYRPWPCHI